MSPNSLYPTTPGPRSPLQFRPLNSSPLVASSPTESTKMTSPLSATQARRRSQFKTPVAARRLFSNELAQEEAADPQKAFLRNRFKARCFERAAKARERAIYGKRKGSMSEPSSDDHPMDDDGEEDEEDIMQDELFRRIMANVKHKQNHAYRVSYAREVGSSYDPDIEDVSRWEQELAEPPSTSTNALASSSKIIQADPFPWLQDEYDDAVPEEALLDLTPVDLADEELEAYAEECARRAALADFEDIPLEELDERWSEDEELGPVPSIDVMDMS